MLLGGDALWSSAGLSWLGSLEEGLTALGGVRAAAGPYRHHAWHLGLPAEPGGGPETASTVSRNGWPPADPAAFRGLMRDDPLDRQAGWMSTDGTTVSLLVALHKMPARRQARTLDGLRALLATAPPGVDARLAGLPLLRDALDDGLRRVAHRFFPLLAVLAVVLLLLLFGLRADSLAPLGLIAVALAVPLGALGWTGEPLDLVSFLLVPLLFVVSLATAIHLLACYRGLRVAGSTPASAAARTLRGKAKPVLWAGLTTGAGFASLVVSPLPAIRSLGAWAAFGIAFLTLAALTFFPALVRLLDGGGAVPAAGLLARLRRRSGGRSRHATPATLGWAVQRRRTVIAVFAVTALLALAGAARLRTSSDLRTYLTPGHPVLAALAAVEAAGMGAVTAEVVVAEEEGSLADPQALAGLAALSAAARRLPGVFGALTAADLADGVARYLPPPVSGDRSAARRAGLERLRSDPRLRPMLGAFLSADGRRARLSVFVPLTEPARAAPLLAALKGEAQRRFPSAAVAVTGQYPLVLAAQRSLLGTVAASLALTVLVVTLLFVVVLRSVRLALRALLPNLWPVLVVLGAMGWCGVPLDAVTVMIAATMLGLAVDDTFHTLADFRRLARRWPAPRAASQAVARLAGAHVATTTLLSASFALLAFAALPPVARFAALAAFAMAAALAADLLLVPALLSAAPAAELTPLLRPAGGAGSRRRRREAGSPGRPARGR